MDAKKEIGARLRRAREALRMTQKEAAEIIGVHPSTLNKYESGNSEPDFETLAKLAKFYGVSSDYLLDIKAEKFDPEWQELYRQLKAKSAEAEATMLLRKADTMTKAQIQDLLRVLEWHVKGD